MTETRSRRMRGEGSVIQRKDGRWVAVLDLGYRNGKRRRKHIYAKDQRDAVKKLDAAKKELAAHGDLPTASLTVEAWLNNWLTNIAPERARVTTLPAYRSQVEQYLIPAIGHHRLDKLSPEHLRGMYRAMADRGLSEATRLKAHRILSRALKVAVREGKVTRNVAELVDSPGTRSRKTEQLDPGEVAQVLAHVAGTRMESRWLAALVLGMRQGECLGLQWGDVDWDAQPATITIGRALAKVDGKLLMVPPKSEAARRTMPLPPVFRHSLERRLDGYGNEAASPGYTDLGLVWGRENGLPRDPRNDYQEWADLLKAAGVKHVRLHDARHSAASTLAALGVPMTTVMAILGHSQISMTSRYVHADLTAMQDAWARLERRQLG